MTLADAHNQAIQETLNRLEFQGLDPDTTKRAMECTNELFHLLAKYDFAAGQVALGIVTGTIANRLNMLNLQRGGPVVQPSRKS